MNTIWEWIRANDTLLAWLGGVGVLLFFASLIAIPIIVAVIPKDYFVRINRGGGGISRGAFRHSCQVLKNLLGIVLLLGGILLLLLPGQGILTMVIGLSLIDFPGKHRLQVRLVQLKSVRKPISWIRRKAGRPELIIP